MRRGEEAEVGGHLDRPGVLHGGGGVPVSARVRGGSSGRRGAEGGRGRRG